MQAPGDDRELLARTLQSISAHVAGRAPAMVPMSSFADPGAALAAAGHDHGHEEVGIENPAAGMSRNGGDLAVFMDSVGGTESGHDPNARNKRTGASGTFQIMPDNWPAWAKAAGVDPADRSAGAQRKVAEHRMRLYFDQFGSWDAVAVAWYAGPGKVAGWLKDPNAPRFNKKQGKGDEPSINEYVAKVRRGMGR